MGGILAPRRFCACSSRGRRLVRRGGGSGVAVFDDYANPQDWGGGGGLGPGGGLARVTAGTLTLNGALILGLGILPGGLMTLCAKAIVATLAT